MKQVDNVTEVGQQQCDRFQKTQPAGDRTSAGLPWWNMGLVLARVFTTDGVQPQEAPAK